MPSTPPVAPSQPTLTQAKWLHKRQRSKDGSFCKLQVGGRENSSVPLHTGGSVSIDLVEMSELTTEFALKTNSESEDSAFEPKVKKSPKRIRTLPLTPTPALCFVDVALR